MQILETHAKNEKEAIELATTYLSVDADQIEIKLYEKGSSGFLGFGEKTPSIYHVNAIENKTPLQVVIKGIVATILHKMGYKAKFIRFETQEDEGKLYVELASPSAGYIIGKKGRTLESLQFVVNLLVERYNETAPKVVLDIENYRNRRAKYLENLAKKIASFVSKTGKSRLLDPLNPYERRLIHVALQDMNNIQTESEGNGVYKKVRISKKSGGQNKKQKQRQPLTQADFGDIEAQQASAAAAFSAHEEEYGSSSKSSSEEAAPNESFEQAVELEAETANEKPSNE